MRGDHASAPRPANDKPTLASILRDAGPDYRAAHKLPPQHLKAMRAIEICRTAALGGHLEACDDGCGFQRAAYHSCCNRHCPQCQTLNQVRWVEAIKDDLLPVPYFHVTFTIPSELRDLALRNQQVFYDLLFRAAADALIEVGREKLGAELGAVAVLHTWSQTLIDHPHIHMLVPGGGLSLNGDRWVPTHGPDYLLPVAKLRSRFRRKLLDALEEARNSEPCRLKFPGKIANLTWPLAWARLTQHLRKIDWVVNVQATEGDPVHVIEYLGRYVLRVAIDNSRIRSVKDGNVTFSYLDRDDHDKPKLMTLATDEFIRRFLCHVLPPGFTKIRYFGLLAPNGRHQRLARARELLGAVAPESAPDTPWHELICRRSGVDPRLCPNCRRGLMTPRAELEPTFNRGPPWR
ncbi:MAG TPA: IS91 family transposase [Chloroflexota bacterium]|nr:IS91 family transposase [Chloroflexota bacterium]